MGTIGIYIPMVTYPFFFKKKGTKGIREQLTYPKIILKRFKAIKNPKQYKCTA
jgi:hypothetical protein